MLTDEKIYSRGSKINDGIFSRFYLNIHIHTHNSSYNTLQIGKIIDVFAMNAECLLLIFLSFLNGFVGKYFDNIFQVRSKNDV